MIKDRCVIYISGDNGAGKDTIAKMLDYINQVGINRAKYSNYITTTSSDKFKTQSVLHFADSLKDVCAIITNLPRELFDSHEYKDDKYWIMDSSRFITQKELDEDFRYYNKIVENVAPYIDKGIDLHDAELQIEQSDRKCAIKLRRLLQYVGTELFRNRFSANTWINLTKRKIVDNLKYYNLAIVADMRFNNEYLKTRSYAENYTTINTKYIIIAIGKGTKEEYDKNVDGVHISERHLVKYDYYVDGSSSKMLLFTEAVKIYQNLIL